MLKLSLIQQYTNQNLTVIIDKKNMLQRNRTMDIGQKKKANLPQSLLNKSGETEENNSRLSNQQAFNDAQCQNHPQKKGKYSVMNQEEGEKTYYCEKCAILVASQGFKVYKLEGQDMQLSERKTRKKPQSRDDDLQDFLGVLDRKLKDMNEMKIYHESILENVEIWQEEAHDRVELFFQEVFCIINGQKEKYLSMIDSKRQELEDQSEAQLGVLDEQSASVVQMKQDIESSYQSIVRETPEQDYNLVMDHYRNNIQQLKSQKVNFNQNYPNLPDLGLFENALDEIFEGSTQTPNYSSFTHSRMQKS